MAMTRDSFLQRLLTSYSAYYDVQRMDPDQAPLAATAYFHVHGVKYVLVRSAQLWAADCNEFIYIFSVPHLTRAVYEQCLQTAQELGSPLIEPNEDHMSSYIVALFLCDQCDEDAWRALRKCRIRKSFQFSLQGWMEVHTAVVDLGKESVTSNFDGNKTAKFLKSVLHPKVRRRSLFRK